MIHDRGDKKWVSLMIPEHKQMLEELYKQQHRSEKPQLDEQEQERLGQLLAAALEYNQTVELTIYSNGTIKTLKGNVQACDSNGQYFTFLTESDERHYVSGEMIIDAIVV